MKILQIFGAVVAVHLLAFIFIFASPGCQSGPRVMPTPDATAPTDQAGSAGSNSFAVTSPQPVDLGTSASTYNSSGHASPTRPGSAAAAAFTPAKPVENVAPVSTYTVERGDSLWSISKKNGLTVAELAKANSISTGTAIKPGRKLIIPGKIGAAPSDFTPMAPAGMSLPAEKTAMPVRPTGAESVKHTVQVGESLGVIARKYQVSVGELAAANNITDPSKVRAGQQLTIPGYKTVTSKATTAAAKPASTTSTPATTTTAPAPAVPHFDLTPPPPGQDLDSGLKPTETEVPTIKVEDASSTPATN